MTLINLINLEFSLNNKLWKICLDQHETEYEIRLNSQENPSLLPFTISIYFKVDLHQLLIAVSFILIVNVNEYQVESSQNRLITVLPMFEGFFKVGPKTICLQCVCSNQLKCIWTTRILNCLVDRRIASQSVSLCHCLRMSLQEVLPRCLSVSVTLLCLSLFPF